MKATVKLLVKDGIKEIHADRNARGDLETWIVKMMNNDAFVIGETDDGTFAAGDLTNIQKALGLGLL